MLSNLSSKFQTRFRYYQNLLFARRIIRLRNVKPIVSFTFDDFPRSALQAGGNCLRDHGVTGTYYTSFGLMNTEGPVGRMFSEDDLIVALTQGHELGCHTFDHFHSWTTDARQFKDSIAKNSHALTRLVPGTSFSTFSYPRSIPRPAIKKCAGERFSCCRGGGYPRLNAHKADLNHLDAFFLEKAHGDVGLVKRLVDSNCEQRGWLILATHDICDNPSRFGCSPHFFSEVVRYAVASGADVLPMASAFRVCSNQVMPAAS